MKFHSCTYFLVTAKEDFPSLILRCALMTGWLHDLMGTGTRITPLGSPHSIELAKKVTSDESALSTLLGVNCDAGSSCDSGCQRGIAERC
jgi:hypothetical protein